MLTFNIMNGLEKKKGDYADRKKNMFAKALFCLSGIRITASTNCEVCVELCRKK